VIRHVLESLRDRKQLDGGGVGSLEAV
jgi:hypothetical protein